MCKLKVVAFFKGTPWTPLVIVKDQSSHFVHLNICINNKPVEKLNSTCRRSCERIVGKNTPLSHKLCAFRCLNWRPQLRSRIKFKYLNEFFIFFFSKTMFLQREPFPTMFYTTNSSPLVFTKYVFCLNNYVE